MNVEKSAHPIIGYRGWSWDGERSRLVGPSTGVAWDPGTTTASCRLVQPGGADGQHDVPDAACVCGLYADYRPVAPVAAEIDVSFYAHYHPAARGRRMLIRNVYGAIALEGRICVHSAGLRGQHAQIVVLAYELDERAQVEEIAALYGAEAVPASELRKAALRFGVEVAPPPAESLEVELSRRLAALGVEVDLSAPTPPPPLPDPTVKRRYPQCPECGQLFMTHDGLRRHRLATHGTDRHGGRPLRATRTRRGTKPPD